MVAPTLSQLQRDQLALASQIGSFTHNPLAYVLYVYPWGKAGTVLEHENGPRRWQYELLVDVGEKLRSGWCRTKALRYATVSGNGIGKSALVSWLIEWSAATCKNTRGVVTASNSGQLETKTWPELAKWHEMSLVRDWFEWSATSFYKSGKNANSGKSLKANWKIDALPWSKENPAGFQGLHNKGSRLLVIFDEAAGIDKVIWTAIEGAMTDENCEIMWFAFGNPDANDVEFKSCFGARRKYWNCRNIDSRSVEGACKPEEIQQWLDIHGEDSDFFKMRVRGIFPESNRSQFIATGLVEGGASKDREPRSGLKDPLIMGVDVAREGEDMSVIGWRRGLDARSMDLEKFPFVTDTMEFAGIIASRIDEHHPDAVFIDDGGVGGGVVDRLRQLGYKVTPTNFGGKPSGTVEGIRVGNKRAEMWLRIRLFLQSGGTIPDDRELISDLKAPNTKYGKNGELLVESKKDMKKRGVQSPDCADALALTFAYQVAQMDTMPGDRGGAGSYGGSGSCSVSGSGGGSSGGITNDYDPFAGL